MDALGVSGNLEAVTEDSTDFNCALALLVGEDKLTSGPGVAVSGVDVFDRSVVADAEEQETSSISPAFPSGLFLFFPNKRLVNFEKFPRLFSRLKVRKVLTDA